MDSLLKRATSARPSHFLFLDTHTCPFTDDNTEAQLETASADLHVSVTEDNQQTISETRHPSNLLPVEGLSLQNHFHIIIVLFSGICHYLSTVFTTDTLRSHTRASYPLSPVQNGLLKPPSK